MFRDCQVLQLQLSFESISGGRAQLLPNVWQKLGPFAPLVVGATGTKAYGGGYFVAGFAFVASGNVSGSVLTRSSSTVCLSPHRECGQRFHNSRGRFCQAILRQYPLRVPIPLLPMLPLLPGKKTNNEKRTCGPGGRKA